MEKVQSHTELQEKLKAAASRESAIYIAKAAVFTIATEDMQSMQSDVVSDEILESAAGGAIYFESRCASELECGRRGR